MIVLPFEYDKIQTIFRTENNLFLFVLKKIHLFWNYSVNRFIYCINTKYSVTLLHVNQLWWPLSFFDCLKTEEKSNLYDCFPLLDKKIRQNLKFHINILNNWTLFSPFLHEHFRFTISYQIFVWPDQSRDYVDVHVQYGGMSSVLCCVVVRFDNFMVLYLHNSTYLFV